MEVGYFTMPLHPPGSDVTQTLDDDLDQIVMLDEMGYREAWIGEHFTTAWENIPCPDLFIAKALGLTKNIILGTGVTCMPNHHPFVVAHRIAQLDHLAHGRFHWGVGTGGTPGDMEAFGFDMEKGDHREMTTEAIDVVLKIWQDPQPGRYESKYWSFNIPEPVPSDGGGFHLKPYQKPHPPIAVAGVSGSSETLKMAGERGWIPMSINLVPTSLLKTHWDAVEEGARRSGRKPQRPMWRIAREVYISDTTENARREALDGVLKRDFEDYFMRLLPRINYMHVCKTDPDMPDSEVDAEYLLDNVWIVGSPEDVADQLRQLYQDVGGFGVLLAMGHEWQPRDRWVNSMSLLAKEVIPSLSDLV